MKFISTMSATLVATVVMAVTCAAQFEGAAWDTLTSDRVKDKLSRQALCSVGNTIHLTYAKEAEAGGWNIHYLSWDSIAGWSADRIVESDIECFDPVIAGCENGGLTLAILFESGGDIYGDVIHDRSEEWNPVNLTNSSEMDVSPGIAIDNSGTVHCAWKRQTEGVDKIAYGRIIDYQLTVEVIEESYLEAWGTDARPVVTIISGLPHIFYCGFDGANYRAYHLHKLDAGGPWVSEMLVTDNQNDRRVSAAVGSNGDIHLAISGDMGFWMPYNVYYLRWDHETETWSYPMMVAGSANDGSVEITGDGNVLVASAGISGIGYTGEIFLSRYTGEYFDTQLLVTLPQGSAPLITFLSDGRGAIVCEAGVSGQGAQAVEILYYGPQYSQPPGCQYAPGDVNGSGRFDGIDVGMAVNFFKGATLPLTAVRCPPCEAIGLNMLYPEGDANGTCNFDGIDIGYMVNHFKYWYPGPPEGPFPTLYCPQCRPAGVTAPLSIPVLKAKTTVKSGEEAE